MNNPLLHSEATSRVSSLFASLASAVLLLAAMPGRLGWWPLLFVALAPLFHAVLYLRPWRALCAGFFFGLLYQAGLLYWIVPVLARYGELPLWLAVPAMLLLAGFMALYHAFFCLSLSLLAGRHLFRERSVIHLVWMAPLLWTALEYLRGWLFSGFPWMDLGYGLAGQPVMIQAADLGGHLLLSFSLVLVNSLLVYIFTRQGREVRWHERRDRRLATAFVAILVFLGGYSFLRLPQIERLQGRALQGRVSIIQGNIPQEEKWGDARKEMTVSRYAGLTVGLQQKNPVELVVWPETALPFYPDRETLFTEVADLARGLNVYLLTGAPSVRLEHGAARYYNSALLLDNEGEVLGHADKQHLVPFGEYVPLVGDMQWIRPLVENAGSFSAGLPGPPLHFGSFSLGTLICYESIFPEISRRWVAGGANLLVNISNDAWYGRSSAPHHSMAMAVLRAVENRRSLTRAANTGISAFVEPSGRIQQATGLFVEAAISRTIPLMTTQTFFQRRGYLFGPACLALSIVLLVLRRAGRSA